MASETTYQLNDQPKLTVTFTVAGTPTDPTTVTATVRKGDGTSTNYTVAAGQIVKDATGVYHLYVTADVAGRWSYKFAGTGTVVDVEQGVFYVIPDWTVSNPTFYLTADELKSTLAISSSSSDVDINVAIIASSRAIDGITRRRFYPDADANQVRYYTPDRRFHQEIDDLLTLTSLATDDDGSLAYATSWASTDYILEPINAAADGQPYTTIRALPQGNNTFHPEWPKSVKVTGKFGWSTTPEDVAQACTILAARYYKIAREAPLGVIAAGNDVALYIGRSDPGVISLLGPYARHRVAVG